MAQALGNLPEKYELVGDVLMVQEGRLDSPSWRALLEDSGRASSLWAGLADVWGLSRVARKAAIDKGPMRESRVHLLYPYPPTSSDKKPGEGDSPEYSPGWVTVVENGISFGFDMTRVMFCSGNVTERMRMAREAAVGQTVVDLYCGIGYYTIPLLLHGKAALVHACEWNPNSLAALKVNLRNAAVQDRCIVHEGDNRCSVAAMVDCADRVLLGLLPSSLGGWSLAAQVLKRTGGIIHVHENVADKDIKEWMEKTAEEFSRLLAGKKLAATILHLEKVKSYAPRVHHVVLDLACVPVT